MRHARPPSIAPLQLLGAERLDAACDGVECIFLAEPSSVAEAGQCEYAHAARIGAPRTGASPHSIDGHDGIFFREYDGRGHAW